MTAEWIATPQQVERVIGAVLPHASSDETLPMICCVNLELTADGRLIAVATDRYTLGAAWASFTDWQEDADPAEPITTRIDAADLKRLFSFLKPHRKTTATWRLTEDVLTVSLDDGQESITVRTVDVEFVNWRPLVGGLAEKAGANAPTLIGFTPRMVSHFLQSAKVLGEEFSAMAWHMGPTAVSAPIIRIGANFVGVLMPNRLPDDFGQLDLSALGITASQETAA